MIVESGNIHGFSNRISRVKEPFVQQCQNLEVKKVNWWPARSYLVTQVFASLPNILILPLDGALTVSIISELCLETCVNVLGRDALLVEKPNDDSLVGLRPFNEKP
jgi:hypothetical protein